MVYFTNNSINQVWLGINEWSSLVAPTYLWKLQNSQGRDVVYFIPKNITNTIANSYANKYQVFEFSTLRSLPQNPIATYDEGCNIYLNNENQYWLTIWEQPNGSTNLDPTLTTNLVLNELAFIYKGQDEVIYTGNTSLNQPNKIYYSQSFITPTMTPTATTTPIPPTASPTPSITASNTPTPSITASQTPTPPPPSNTPTMTPTNTQTQTPTSSLTPTPTLTPYLQFCIDTGFDYPTEGVLVSTGNTLYVYGSMEFYDNNAINKIVRINQTSGIIDNNFVPGFPDSVDYVYSVVEASNGDLYAGGTFTNFAGEVRQGIVKMTNTGQEVLTFDSGSGFNNPVTSMVLDEANNALYVSGQFTTYNGTGANRLVKLDATTGAIDTTFSTGFGTGFNNAAYDLLLDGLGGLYVGGAFTQFQGATNNRIIKLDANAGTKDTSFVNTTGASSSVYNIQSDGADLYLTGAFSSVRGVSSPRVCKISTLGVVDASYAGTGANTSINASHLDSFGRLIIAGPSTLTWQGTLVNGLARLNTDGTLDTTFVSNNGTSFLTGYAHSFQGNDSPITTDAFGNIYITGDFGSFNGVALNNFVKIDSDGFLITINNCDYPPVTPTPTNSPTASITPSNTETPSPTPTNTMTQTPTNTSTQTPTPTPTEPVIYPDSIGDLKLWFISTSGFTPSTWTNYGSEGDLNQATGSEQPTTFTSVWGSFTGTTINFDVNDNMTAGLASVNYSASTTFLVYNIESSTPTAQTGFYADNWHLEFDNVTKRMEGRQTPLDRWFDSGATTNQFLNVPVLARISGNTSTTNFELNGVDMPNSSGYSASSTWTFFRIAQDLPQDNLLQVAEVISYNRQLTPSEFNGVTNYLRNKYQYYTW